MPSLIVQNIEGTVRPSAPPPTGLMTRSAKAANVALMLPGAAITT